MKFCRGCGVAVAVDDEPSVTAADGRSSRSPEGRVDRAAVVASGPPGGSTPRTRGASRPRQVRTALAVGALALVVGTGGFAAARLLTDGETASSPSAGQPQRGGGADGAGMESPRAVPEDANEKGAPRSETQMPRSAVEYTSYTPDSYGYTTEIPVGPEWSTPSGSQPTVGELFRATIDGPEGLVLLIDYTPRELARFGAGFSSRREIAHPVFGTATEYVFSGGTIPQCEASTCFDYVLNDEARGAGYAVVAGGGTDPELAQAVARHVANNLVRGP